MVKTIFKNIGWLILVALPCSFLLVWVQTLIEGSEGSQKIGYALETGLFYYLGSILYIALGGLLHQIFLLFFSSKWSLLKHRIIALLLTPIIPLLLILLGERVQTITDFLIPVVIGLGIYAFFLRPPKATQR